MPDRHADTPTATQTQREVVQPANKLINKCTEGEISCNAATCAHSHYPRFSQLTRADITKYTVCNPDGFAVPIVTEQGFEAGFGRSSVTSQVTSSNHLIVIAVSRRQKTATHRL